MPCLKIEICFRKLRPACQLYKGKKNKLTTTDPNLDFMLNLKFLFSEKMCLMWIDIIDIWVLLVRYKAVKIVCLKIPSHYSFCCLNNAKGKKNCALEILDCHFLNSFNFQHCLDIRHIENFFPFVFL